MKINNMNNNEKKDYSEMRTTKGHISVKWAALGITAIIIVIVGLCVHFANTRKDEMAVDYEPPVFSQLNPLIEKYKGRQSGANIVSLISEIKSYNTSNSKKYNIKFIAEGWKNSSGEDINLNTSNADDTYLSNAMASVVKNHLYTVALEYNDTQGNITNVTVTY